MSCDKIYLRKDQITCDEEAGVSLKDLIVQVIKENPNFFASLIFQSISTGGGGGSISTPMALDDLTDVVSPNSASGDLLYRTPQEWINTPGVFELLKYKASTVARESNPNITMGSVGSDYVFEGRTLQELIEDMFFVYQAPTFSSFGFSTTPLYIGEKLPSTNTFTWSYTNPNNIQGDITITDTTNNNVLYNNISKNDTSKQHTYTIDIVKYKLDTHTWTISAYNTLGASFSRARVISWGAKIFTCIGEESAFDINYLYNSNNLTPTSNISSVLTSLSNVTVNISGSGSTETFKFILIPINSTFNSNTYSLFSLSNIVFKDVDAPVGFDTYDAVQTGTITITNEHGLDIEYAIFRGPNPSTGEFSIKIN